MRRRRREGENDAQAEGGAAVEGLGRACREVEGDGSGRGRSEGRNLEPICRAWRLKVSAPCMSCPTTPQVEALIKGLDSHEGRSGKLRSCL